MNYPVLSSKICFLNVLQMDKTAMKFLGWKVRRRRYREREREANGHTLLGPLSSL